MPMVVPTNEMKNGTNGYKRFSIKPRWPFYGILKNSGYTVLALCQKIENDVFSNRLRYK